MQENKYLDAAGLSQYDELAKNYIDSALSKKAENSIVIESILLASEWNDDKPYTQSITVEGLGADQNGMVFISQDANIEEKEVATSALLSVDGQGEGFLTLVSNGICPSIDIPVTVILLG